MCCPEAARMVVTGSEVVEGGRRQSNKTESQYHSQGVRERRRPTIAAARIAAEPTTPHRPLLLAQQDVHVRDRSNTHTGVPIIAGHSSTPPNAASIPFRRPSPLHRPSGVRVLPRPSMSIVVNPLRCTHVTDVDAAGVDSSRRLVVIHGLVRLSLRLGSRLLLELNVSFVAFLAMAALTAFFSASISARRACISLSSCCQLGAT